MASQYNGLPDWRENDDGNEGDTPTDTVPCIPEWLIILAEEMQDAIDEDDD